MSLPNLIKITKVCKVSNYSMNLTGISRVSVSSNKRLLVV